MAEAAAVQVVQVLLVVREVVVLVGVAKIMPEVPELQVKETMVVVQQLHMMVRVAVVEVQAQ